MIQLLIFFALFISYSSQTRTLPENLIIGYAQQNECDYKMVTAAKNGVNVIIWFQINIVDGPTGPEITGGPNMQCVAQQIKAIRDLGLNTTHMIAAGGWNCVHIGTKYTAQQVFDNWKIWNEQTIADPSLDFHGFDGLDWDIEGVNDKSSPNNEFTVKGIEIMGRFAQLMKKDGYLMSMAPPESYLDPTTPDFSLSLLYSFKQYPNFGYHGHNIYGFLLTRYGLYLNPKQKWTRTFDFISVQLYETYDHTEYNLTVLKQDPVDYLEKYVERLQDGWMTDFSEVAGIDYHSRPVHLEKFQVVIGIPNSWAVTATGVPYIEPTHIAQAYKNLKAKGKEPRGFMFWTIGCEGDLVNGQPLYMAKELNAILHTRDTNNEDIIV